MSITRLTCRKCRQEFDYNNPIQCEDCNMILPLNICISCHNKTHYKPIPLARRYGVYVSGVTAWAILSVSFIGVFLH